MLQSPSLVFEITSVDSGRKAATPGCYHESVQGLDYSWIVDGRLAQGAYPGADPSLWKHFDVIVYTAEERQPIAPRLPPGKKVLRAPLDDAPRLPTPVEESYLLAVVPAVERALRAGQRVLVTCQAGRNRSGLVVALVLMRLYPRESVATIVAAMQRRRRPLSGPVLSNEHFVRRLELERRR